MEIAVQSAGKLIYLDTHHSSLLNYFLTDTTHSLNMVQIPYSPMEMLRLMATYRYQGRQRISLNKSEISDGSMDEFTCKSFAVFGCWEETSGVYLRKYVKQTRYLPLQFRTNFSYAKNTNHLWQRRQTLSTVNIYRKHIFIEHVIVLSLLLLSLPYCCIYC